MNNKKRGIALAVSVVLLSGCGNAIPELTEEQHDLVVEYAAGTLLKYDKNHASRVIEISELEEIEAQSAAMEAILTKGSALNEEETVTEEVEKADTENTATEVFDNTQQEAPVYAAVEDFIKEEQLTFNYAGYEIVNEYPSHEPGDVFFFVMSATPGNELLVVKFRVENTSGSDVSLDMGPKNIRFKISVDGKERNALTTMLLNDMAYYQGTILAGESTELVLVCEIPEEKAGDVSAIELIMKNVDNTATISLN